jgi:hypothetical protein
MSNMIEAEWERSRVLYYLLSAVKVASAFVYSQEARLSEYYVMVSKRL